MFIRSAARGLIATVFLSAGCAAPRRLDNVREELGRIVYLDGAGGGGVLTNWAGGVRDGLRQAGYDGGFENYGWQTGLGVVVDQEASVEYKRSKAGAVADEIATYRRAHAGASVNVVALSAGTAVAVYALEQLPANSPVDNVVLLGSSLSNHYDLTEALKRVRNHMYVFTSEKDAVLRFGASAFGTADRKYCGACSAGLNGFHLVSKSAAESRRQYAKVENIEWQPEFSKYGNPGGHTGAVNARFVKRYIAPLLMRTGPRFLVAAQPPEAEEPEGSSVGQTSDQP